MSKSPDAFRTISEVADWLGIQAHVLRFWESKFSQVKPVKRAGGRRYYRPSDMQLIGGIKQLLHDDGLTIKGVQKILREQGIAHVAAMSKPLEDGIEAEVEATPADAPESDATVLRFRAAETPKAPTAPVEDDAGLDTPAAAEDAAQTAPSVSEADAAEQPLDAEPAAAQPSLPSFMHGAGMGAAPEPETAEPTETATLRPSVIDAPDPPTETDLPYTPGLLASLASLEQISPDQAREIAPLVQQLRQWVDRATAAGAA